MYLLESVCNDASFMATMLFIKKIVQIIFIIAPILLILLLTIDFSKAVMANDETRIKHLKDVAIKRVLFAMLLFFVPLIVDTSFSLLDSSKSKVIDCYNNASNENVERLVSGYELDMKNKEESNLTKTEKIRQKQKEEAEKRKKLAANAKNLSSSGSACTNCPMAEKIASTAESFAWPSGSSSSKYDWDKGGRPTEAAKEATKKYYPSWTSNNYYKIACCCHSTRVIVSAVTGKKVGNLLPNTNSKSSAKKELEDSLSGLNFEIFAWDGKESSLRRGDILVMAWKSGGGHVQTYLGNKKTADGGRTSNTFSHISKQKSMNENMNDYYYFYVIRYKE